MHIFYMKILGKNLLANLIEKKKKIDTSHLSDQKIIDTNMFWEMVINIFSIVTV